VLGRGSVFGGYRRVSHAHHVDSVTRDLMAQNQVTYDRVRHPLRGGDRGLTATRGEALNFDDVAALILQWGCHLVERILRLLAQDALAGTKKDFSLRASFVLVDVAHHLLRL